MLSNGNYIETINSILDNAISKHTGSSDHFGLGNTEMSHWIGQYLIWPDTEKAIMTNPPELPVLTNINIDMYPTVPLAQH